MLASARSGWPGIGCGLRGLFFEAHHAPIPIDAHHAKRAGVRERHLRAPDRQVRLARDVKREHSAIVHLVNVVTGEHQHVLRRMPVQHGQVLEDGVGRAAVPRFGNLLLRRQQFDELLEAAVEETPAALDVANQAVRLVLRGHPDAANAGIHAVGEREIDDAELAAERHRRLAAPVGELFQPGAAPTGEHQRDRGVRELADEANRLGFNVPRAVISVPTMMFIERHVVSRDGLQ